MGKWPIVPPEPEAGLRRQSNLDAPKRVNGDPKCRVERLLVGVSIGMLILLNAQGQNA